MFDIVVDIAFRRVILMGQEDWSVRGCCKIGPHYISQQPRCATYVITSDIPAHLFPSIPLKNLIPPRNKNPRTNNHGTKNSHQHPTNPSTLSNTNNLRITRKQNNPSLLLPKTRYTRIAPTIIIEACEYDCRGDDDEGCVGGG